MSWRTRLSRALPVLIALVALAALSSGAIGVSAQTPGVSRLHTVLQKNPALANNPKFQASLATYLRRTGPGGAIPASARQGALAETQQIDRAQAAQRAAGHNLPPAVANWVSVGSAPELAGQIGSTLGTRDMSGRVTAIAVDPTDTTHWLIGGAQGGVWETHNSGATWAALTDSQASLAMGAIAYAPSNNQVIYAGTGEGSDSTDSYAGAGILKSVNGGATWTLVGAAQFAGNAVDGLLVSPTDPNTVVAGSDNGIAGRVYNFPNSPATGVFRSTNGGTSWAQTLNQGPVTDLKADPTNFLHQLAGVSDTFDTSTNGLYRSLDGGATWTKLTTTPWNGSAKGVGRIELAIGTNDPNTAYVSIQDGFTFNLPQAGTDGGLLGLWKTSNIWAATPTWTQISAALTDDGTGVHGYCGWDKAFGSATDQCWYSHVLTVDPANVNTLYAGGVPLWKCDCTTPATPTWTEISKTLADPTHGMHVDQHAFAWAGTRLLAGNDGGVWSTTDGGTTINDHNTNLSIAQYFFGAVHPTNASIAIAGAQDNGSQRWTGTQGWAAIGGGDGVLPVISPSSPNTHWAISSQNLSIQRTINGGASYSNSGTPPGLPAGAGDAAPDAPPFIAVYAMCPTNENIALAGTTFLDRSTNFFSSVPGNPTWANNDSPNTYANGVSAIAFAKADATCGTYAFGDPNGVIRLTQNSGATWKTLSGAALPALRPVIALAFDPANANTLYVTFGGFNAVTPAGHVFKSTNALGASPTFNNVSPAVDIPFNAIVVDPGASGSVYAGSDIGVWQSTDGAATWTHMGPSQGMPNVAVFDLQISRGTNQLMAFTHGRGAFTLALPPVGTLSYTQQPVGAAPGANLATQPKVALVDGSNAVLTSFTGPVSVAIKSGTGAGGAVLSGTTTLNAVAGVATFSGLSINLAGTGYVLTASSTGYTSVDSNPFNITASTTCTNANFTAPVTTSGPAGPTINLTAAATCPNGSTPIYRYWEQTPTVGWHIVQNYSTNATYPFVTSGLQAGNYFFEVDVKQQGSGLDQETAAQLVYTITATACTSGLLTSPLGTSFAPGPQDLLAGSASCNGIQLFRFWEQTPTTGWQIVQNYSTTSTYPWATTGQAVGGYWFEVDIKNQGSAQDYETFGLLHIFLTQAACTSGALTADHTSPQLPGPLVTLTGAATCAGPKLYRFWEQTPTIGWHIVQNYSTTATYPWTTAAQANGGYWFEVDVKNQGSAQDYETFGTLHFVLDSTAPCTTVSIAFDHTQPQTPATTVRITPSTDCGAPLFRYWIQDPATGWHLVQDYGQGTQTFYDWTAATAGNYYIEVDVKNQGDPADYSQFALVTFRRQ